MLSKKSMTLLKYALRRPAYSRFFCQKVRVEYDEPINEEPKHKKPAGQQETITIGGNESAIKTSAMSYTPVKQIKFYGETYTVFDQVAIADEDRVGPVPYEIKETTVKNILCIIACVYLNMNYSLMYGLPAFGFLLNWFYRVQSYMANAIVKMELSQSGDEVVLTLKTGKVIKAKVQDIYKLKDEKHLVETFDEPYLFPIEIRMGGDKKKKLYFYGRGHEAIRDGELFRAIINGRPLKL